MTCTPHYSIIPNDSTAHKILCACLFLPTSSLAHRHHCFSFFTFSDISTLPGVIHLGIIHNLFNLLALPSNKLLRFLGSFYFIDSLFLFNTVYSIIWTYIRAFILQAIIGHLGCLQVLKLWNWNLVHQYKLGRNFTSMFPKSVILRSGIQWIVSWIYGRFFSDFYCKDCWFGSVFWYCELNYCL